MMCKLVQTLVPRSMNAWSFRHRSYATLQPPRGMPDIPSESLRKNMLVERMAQDLAASFGYSPIETPLLEATSLFTRCLGETSDVVMKEMFTLDEGKLCLRPEGTAGVLRAFLNSPSSYNDLPHRYFYSGSMFRYERPQKGRLRQFHQCGLEVIGTGSSVADAEVIGITHALFTQLSSQYASFAWDLKINSLGDEDSRVAYQQLLRDFLWEQKEKLSPLSLERLERGSILRILDSKEVEDQPLLRSADLPSLKDALTPASLQQHADVCGLLEEMQIPFVEDSRLVRGLDYYSHTVFEFVDPLSGKAMAAGGRYDGLARLLQNGRDISAVGCALGIERIVLAFLSSSSVKIPLPFRIAVAALDKASFSEAVGVAHRLRGGQLVRDIVKDKDCDHVAVIMHTEPISSLAKFLRRCTASVVVLVGEEEIAGQFVTWRDMEDRAQKQIKWDDL